MPVALSTSLKAHSLIRYSAFAGALSVSSEYSAPSASPATEAKDALYLVPPMVWQGVGEQVGAPSSPVAVFVSVYPTSLQHEIRTSRFMHAEADASDIRLSPRKLGLCLLDILLWECEEDLELVVDAGWLLHPYDGWLCRRPCSDRERHIVQNSRHHNCWHDNYAATASPIACAAAS